MDKLLIFLEAINLVFKQHANQVRLNSSLPYAIHPIRILTILRFAGYSEEKNFDLMVAVLLHDVVEDTETSIEQISDQFGNNVAKIVKELTHLPNSSKRAYLKSFEFASKNAKIVKLADRIDNLLDLENSNWSEPKKLEYLKEAEILLNKCGRADDILGRLLRSTIKNKLEYLKKL